MNIWKLSEMLKIVVLLACCFTQQIMAGSIVKDLVIASIVKNILKPRFVPLPIPIPLPIKFQKHTHKPYPVPLHSHALAAHHIGHGPLSFHLGGAHLSLPSLHHLPVAHEAVHAVKAIAPPVHAISPAVHAISPAVHAIAPAVHEVGPAIHAIAPAVHAIAPTIDDLALKAASPVFSKVIVDDLAFKAHSSIADKVLVDDLALKAATPILHDNVIVGGLGHGADLIHASSNNLHTVHHDIESIGGLDLLTDLDELGTHHEWW